MTFARTTMRSIAFALTAFAACAAPSLAAPDLGPEPGAVRLNASVTVAGTGIRLGDLFAGHPLHEEKVVAPAPRPGQRIVLAADTLAGIARTYGLDWRPTDAFDRAVVFRPGLTLAPAETLAAIKADLVLKGLPERFGLRPAAPLPMLVVPAEAMPPITVREAFYDDATRAFSAVAEIAGPDGTPLFLQVRGTAIATVTVPVLRADASHADVITEAMIEQADVPEAEVRGDVITDPALLLGKSPRAMVRAGRPIRNTDVVRLTLVDVPVLRAELRRDTVIHDSHLTWARVNAADLPPDAVLDTAYLIGKSPRSFLVANAPIRRGDVMAVRQVSMAVATRDLARGAAITKADVNWVATTDNELQAGAIVDPALLQGRVTTRPVRAGQTLLGIDVTRPTLINRGKLVTIVYVTPIMKLTVQGEALEDGGLSEAIRVANAKSKTTVVAEVLDANTVRVVSQQSAMQ